MAETDKTRQITVKQDNAIGLILQGLGDSEVAEKIGVSRQTVNGWKNNDAYFIAELNRRKQEIWNSQLEHLLSMVIKAVSVLEEDLNDSKDKRIRQNAAVHILKVVGLYGVKLRPEGPIDPIDVEHKKVLEEQSRQLMKELVKFE